MKMRAFFSHVARLWGDENPRPGFDNWRSESIPLTTLLKKSPYFRTGFFRAISLLYGLPAEKMSDPGSHLFHLYVP